MRHARTAFTLVEILIVVIILGILATIVIPQVSTASSDARMTSTRSTLQKVRAQIEVFKLEHAGCPPQTTGLWTLMLSQSSTAETAVANPVGTKFGPYLQAVPHCGFNDLSSVSTAATDLNAGWYYTCDTTSYELRASISIIDGCDQAIDGRLPSHSSGTTTCSVVIGSSS
jgi:type II secretion system protein G